MVWRLANNVRIVGIIHGTVPVPPAIRTAVILRTIREHRATAAVDDIVGIQMPAANVVASQLAAIRDPGVMLLAAITTATGQPVMCECCRQYLLSLSVADVLDADEITLRLTTDMELPLPSHLLVACGTQQARQEWLRPIVTATLLDWVQQ